MEIGRKGWQGPKGKHQCEIMGAMAQRESQGGVEGIQKNGYTGNRSALATNQVRRKKKKKKKSLTKPGKKKKKGRREEVLTYFRNRRETGGEERKTWRGE